MMSALALSSVQRNKMLVRMVHKDDNEDNDAQVKEANSIRIVLSRRPCL